MAEKKKSSTTQDALSDIRAASAAAPEYKENEEYASLSENLLNSILNTRDFSYDMNSDALYNQYKQLYSEQGRQAAEHVYGLGTSLTGGYGNSYAASAANAAYSEYMSKLAEKAAELESSAYEKYKDKNETLRENFNTVNSLMESDYDKYRDSVSDYQKEAELDISRGNLDIKKAQLAADNRKDEISLAFTAAEAGDYSLLKALGIDTSQYEYDKKLSDALKLAEIGDYSGLRELGINTGALIYANILEYAKELADYGDYSALIALGFDPTDIQQSAQLEKALEFAKLGDFSLLEQLGFTVPEEEQTPEKISISIQNGAQSAYAAGGMSGLTKYLDNQIAFGQLTEEGKQTILNTYKKK